MTRDEQDRLAARLVTMLDHTTGRIRFPKQDRIVTMSIIDWLHDQPSYCLDAPEAIPAGGVINTSINTPKGRSDSTTVTMVKRE